MVVKEAKPPRASNKLIYIYIRRQRTAHYCTVWGYVRFNFSPHTPPPNSTVTYIREDREREIERCQWPRRVTVDSRGSRLWSICAGWSNIAVTSATQTCPSVTVWGACGKLIETISRECTTSDRDITVLKGNYYRASLKHTTTSRSLFVPRKEQPFAG